ncbi:MAG: hypothetical protein GY868_06505 [Deltaproteobacteria bacterium]|nr:hypothetical protein [Deltaproteobacteria bacterium]
MKSLPHIALKKSGSDPQADLKRVCEKLNVVIDRLNTLTLEEEWWVTKLRKIREDNLEGILKNDMPDQEKRAFADSITMLADGAKYRIVHQAKGRVETAEIIMQCKDLILQLTQAWIRK